MPHKHTRKGMIDKNTVDLPPTEFAKPLSVSKSSASNGIFTTDLSSTNKRANSNKRKRKADTNDDTPKAFARLMAFQRGEKLPKGLDDGIRVPKKKVKVAANGKEGGDAVAKEDNKKKKAAAVEEKREIPTIRPGERMSDFNVRVDAALPVSGLINKTARDGKDPLGLKVGRTKTERRMHRMYDEWRAEEKKIQDKRLDDREAAEEDEMGEDEHGQVRWKADIEAANAAVSSASGSKKKKKKAKGKKKVIGEVDVGEADPWAKIKRDRGEVKAGLHDVVLAPPVFTKVPREKFKVRGAGVEVGDVPKSSGSLRRREELEVERRSVVEGYRAMMKANKGKKDD